MTLQLEAATVIRGGRAILADATFSAQAGRFTALCGPNGAGKTTALSALAGSLQPERGRASLDGKNIADLRPLDLARRRAVLPQSPILSFPFRVHEVVAMGRTPHHGRSTPQYDLDVTAAAMARVDILPFAERNYLTLSGGERQRVQLARAIAQIWDPPEDGSERWLLLDEPTAALDLKYQIRLIRLLRSLADEGWGILAVLHDLPLVRRSADHVVMFRHGRVHAEGGPETVLSDSEIELVFELDEPLGS